MNPIIDLSTGCFTRIRPRGGQSTQDKAAYASVYEFMTGKERPRGRLMVIMHKCDNPSHIHLGTQRSNIQDAFLKGRKSGKRGSNSKLTEIDVERIRKLKKEGMKQCEIAKMFPVNENAISRIIRNTRWKIEC